MRIVLLYPPPREIASAEPGESGESAIDKSDACVAPYGMLSLAAQALRDGHQVKTFNLATFPWNDVEALLGGLDADVYGLTCFTSNRLGVALAADCIRRYHPRAHVVVGGPHVTALPAQTLDHYRAIDTVVIGEGEETFAELLARLEAGEPIEGIPGTAWRGADGPCLGPPRTRIDDLDALAPVQQYFPCNLLLTSRGCPGRCTFCASNAMWGKRVSFHSADHVLDTLEGLLPRLPIRTVMIKDDTFTARRTRALRICRGILDRKLNFLWSCDTRADALDEELLRTMRLAGCQQIALGVESASPDILRSIRKKVTCEQVLEATRLARKFGLHVRYFMIAGNRGETTETFRQSVEFLRQAQPNEYVFSILSVYPGTEEFEIFKARGQLDEGTFFRTDAPELWMPPEPAILEELMRDHYGLKVRPDSLEQCQSALAELPDLHAAHLDVGAAYFRAGRLDEAEHHIRRALELGYPVPDLAWNYLAGLAGRRGDLEGMKAQLEEAAQRPNPHPLVAQNARALSDWLAAGGRRSGRKLNLAMRHTFQAVLPDAQPMVPAPLPADSLDWLAPEPARARGTRVA
ncbi:MAG TPA: radical SAM protein, partial [Polyangia bacterium]|nr:radical SAM protein [Polyangia bacterium]